MSLLWSRRVQPAGVLAARHTASRRSTVLVALFEARHGSTPVTLSTPGTGFTQCQANDQAPGDTVCTTNYITYQVVSSVQTNVSTSCASSPAASRTQSVLLAYAQAVSSLTMPAKKRKRPWRRSPRRAGRRSLPATTLFLFRARRQHKQRPKAFRHHKRWFWGDITPIAAEGHCFTITVSEQLGATILIEEYLAATAVEFERRSATILATERLSARAVISERLTCTIRHRLLSLEGTMSQVQPPHCRVVIPFELFFLAERSQTCAPGQTTTARAREANRATPGLWPSRAVCGHSSL